MDELPLPDLEDDAAPRVSRAGDETERAREAAQRAIRDFTSPPIDPTPTLTLDSDPEAPSSTAHGPARVRPGERVIGDSLVDAPVPETLGVLPRDVGPTPYAPIVRDAPEPAEEFFPPRPPAERLRRAARRPLEGRGPLWLGVHGAIVAAALSLVATGAPLPATVGAAILVSLMGLLSEAADEAALAAMRDEARQPAELPWRRPDLARGTLRGLLVLMGAALAFVPGALLVQAGLPPLVALPFLLGPLSALPLMTLASGARGLVHTLDAVLVRDLARALGRGYLRAVLPGALVVLGAVTLLLLVALIMPGVLTRFAPRTLLFVFVGALASYGVTFQAGTFGTLMFDRQDELAPILHARDE